MIENLPRTVIDRPDPPALAAFHREIPGRERDAGEPRRPDPAGRPFRLCHGQM